MNKTKCIEEKQIKYDFAELPSYYYKLYFQPRENR